MVTCLRRITIIARAKDLTERRYNMAEKKDCIFNRADDYRALKMKYCRWEEKECKFYKSCKIYNETGMLKTRKE
jgi:hypothetical protein